MKIRKIEVSLTEGIEPRFRISEPGSLLSGFCKTLPLRTTPREAYQALMGDIDPWTLLVLIPAWPTLLSELKEGQQRARRNGTRFVARFDNAHKQATEVSTR